MDFTSFREEFRLRYKPEKSQIRLKEKVFAVDKAKTFSPITLEDSSSLHLGRKLSPRRFLPQAPAVYGEKCLYKSV